MAFNGKPVLVATDLSARCDRAVDRAATLARYWRTRLKVVHVLEPGAKTKDNIKLAEEAVRAILPDPEADVDILLPVGRAPETIARTANETSSGIIVTGVARYNDITDYFLGTAVDYVIRNASVPVLVVKQRLRGPYRRLLVATDFSDCSRRALLVAAELFPEASVHLVHAYHVPYETWLNSERGRREIQEDVQRNLDDFLNHPSLPKDLRERINVKLDYGETAAVVAKALADTDAELIVLGTRGHNSLGHATLGSTAESLLSWVEPDTLMVGEPKPATSDRP
ncbi:universal stress protein UspA [Paramesorhizobium deserti]|uniref:Universal stress protein UspA n=1 Tax=Paramesorhizobium deserti TaxID=1494590 RepID=A0A135HRQ3_9HYPH|nr:universal stress protein [Paramesorhizobium deserti]KXF75876.1 universal stress protein UspA [Paramesorhizobium deserti]